MKKFLSTFKRKLNSKNQGSMMDMVGTSLCILFILVVVITSIHFYKLLEVKRHLNDYARDYILILEEHGELTADEVSDLITRMNELGFNNVSVTYNGDNSLSRHGEEVSIDIVIVTNPTELRISKVYDFILDNYTFSVHRASTAKH